MTHPIDPVPWESRFFGFPIGKIEPPENYTQEELETTLREAHSKYRLMFVTVFGEGPDSLSLLGNKCPCYVRKLFFKKDVPEKAEVYDDRIKAYTSTFCIPALERLAVQSGTMTQFRQDPELDPHFEQLFLAWINFAVTKELADSIWTWNENGKHFGLATIRCAKRTDPETGQTEKEGRIGMMSVDVNQRRRGIGTNIIKACDFWCSSLNIPVNAIFTQKDNEPAIALCKKLGFRQNQEGASYHYWSPGWIYDSHRGWITHG
jgi:RimJ/RimL family protein N-acetyltransferase